MSALYPIGIGATLCCIFAVLLETTAAPFQHEQQPEATGLEPYYTDSSAGCYYNFQHYDEGDRIITNEPCLNCTCHNRMLMCYLRVCPFSKEIGQDCTVEKKLDQCCPEITCPEVPVHLLSEVTTLAPDESTELGHLDNYGCSIDEVFYSDGAQVPSNPHRPCELCYCIRNRTACVMQECTLQVEGCKPVYQEGVCCPARYDCDYDEDNLETTVKPTPGLIFTTTLQPGGNTECYHNNEVYADGALIFTEKPCDHCYCMKGEIVCAVQNCGTPLENVGKNCTALPTKEGKCCPDTYECVTESPLAIVTTEPYLETTPIKDDRLNEVTESEVQVTESVVQETEEPVVSDVTETQETEAVQVTTESVAQEAVPVVTEPDHHHEPAEIDNEIHSESTTEYEEKVTETIMIKETKPIDTEHDKLYRVTETIPDESTQIIEDQVTTQLPELNELDEDDKQVTDKTSPTDIKHPTSHEESTTLKEYLTESTEHISQDEHIDVTEEQVSVTHVPVYRDMTLVPITTDDIQQVTESQEPSTDAPVEEETHKVQPVEFETTQAIVPTTEKIEQLITETSTPIHDIIETTVQTDEHVTETQNNEVTENIQQTTESVKQTPAIETSSLPQETEITDETTEHVSVEETPTDKHDDVIPETTESSEKNVEEDILVVTEAQETTENITELEGTVSASEEPEHVEPEKHEPTVTEASTTSVDDKIRVPDATEEPHVETTHTPEEQFSETTSKSEVTNEHVEPMDSLTTITPSIDIVQSTEHPVVITKESTTDVIPTVEDTNTYHQEPEKSDEDNIVVDVQTTSQPEVEVQVTDKIELSTKETVTSDTLHMVTEVQEPSKIETADHVMETTATPLDESQHSVTHVEPQQPEEHLTIGSAITEAVTEGIMEHHTTSKSQEEDKSAVTDDLSYTTSSSAIPEEEVQKETKPVLEQEKIDEQPHMTSPSDVSITTEKETPVDVLPSDDGQHVIIPDEEEHQTTSIPSDSNIEHEGSGHIETSEQPTDETPTEQSTKSHEEQPIKTDTPEYQQATEASVSETDIPIVSTIDEQQPTEIHLPEVEQPTEVAVTENSEQTEANIPEIQKPTEAVVLEEHEPTETHHLDEQEPTKVNLPEHQTEMHLDEESSTISQLPQDVTHLLEEHTPTEAQPEEHITTVHEDIQQTTAAQLPEEPIEIQIPEEHTDLPPEKHTTVTQLSEEQTLVDQQITTPISEEQQSMKTDIPLVHTPSATLPPENQNELHTPDDQQVSLAPESDKQQTVEPDLHIPVYSEEQTTVVPEEQPIEPTETALPEEVPVTKFDKPTEQSSESQTFKEQETTLAPALDETQPIETHIPEEQISTESHVPEDAQTTAVPELIEPSIVTHIPEEYTPTEIVTEISVDSHTPEDRQTTVASRLDEQTHIQEEHSSTETIISEVSTESHIPEDMQTTVVPKLDEQTHITEEHSSTETIISEISTESHIPEDMQTTVVPRLDEQTHITEEHSSTETIISEVSTESHIPEDMQTTVAPRLDEQTHITEEHSSTETIISEVSTESHIPEDMQTTVAPKLDEQTHIPEEHSVTATIISEVSTESHIPEDKHTTVAPRLDDQEPIDVVLPEEQSQTESDVLVDIQTTVTSVSDEQPIETHTTEKHLPTDTIVSENEPTTASLPEEVDQQFISTHLPEEQVPTETQTPETIHTTITTGSEEQSTESHKAEEHVSIEDQQTTVSSFEEQYSTKSHTIDEQYSTAAPDVVEEHVPDKEQPTESHAPDDQNTSVTPEQQTIEPMITVPEVLFTEDQTTVSGEEQPIGTHTAEEQVPTDASVVDAEQTSEPQNIAGETTTVVSIEDQPIKMHVPVEQLPIETHTPEEHTATEQLPTEASKSEEHTPSVTYEPEVHTPSDAHLETQQPIDTHTPEEQMPTEANIIKEQSSEPQNVIDEEQATASSTSEETPIPTHVPHEEIKPDESNIPTEVPEEKTPIDVHLPHEEPTTEIHLVTEPHILEQTTMEQGQETQEPIHQELITTAQPVEYEITEKQFTIIPEEDKLEEHTTLAQEQVINEVTENVSDISEHEIQNTESPETSTNAIKIETTKVESQTTAHELPTTEYIVHTSDESTEAVTLKEDGHSTEHVLPESHEVTTTINENEIQITEVPEHHTPEVVTEKESTSLPVVPGEGSCLVEGQTYENNTLVPSMNPCQTTCSCVSSIVQCESVRCLPPPVNMENCMPIYHSAHSCCPTYACTGTKPTEIESDSHMFETTVATTDDKLNEESTGTPPISTVAVETSVETEAPAVVGQEIEEQKTVEPEQTITTQKTITLPVHEEEIPDKDVETQQTQKPEELPFVTTVQEEIEQTSTISAEEIHVIVTTPQSEDNELTQEKASEGTPVDGTTEEVIHVEPSVDETPATTAKLPEEPEIKVTTSIPREEEKHTEATFETERTEQPLEISTKTSLDIDESVSMTTTGAHVEEQSEITEKEIISVTESVIHNEGTISPESHVTEQNVHIPTSTIEQEHTTEYVHLEKETETYEEISTPASIHPDADDEHKSSISETEITKEVDVTTKVYESSETPIKESEKPIDKTEEPSTTDHNILEIEDEINEISTEKQDVVTHLPTTVVPQFDEEIIKSTEKSVDVQVTEVPIIPTETEKISITQEVVTEETIVTNEQTTPEIQESESPETESSVNVVGTTTSEEETKQESAEPDHSVQPPTTEHTHVETTTGALESDIQTVVPQTDEPISATVEPTITSDEGVTTQKAIIENEVYPEHQVTEKPVSEIVPETVHSTETVKDIEITTVSMVEDEVQEITQPEDQINEIDSTTPAHADEVTSITETEEKHVEQTEAPHLPEEHPTEIISTSEQTLVTEPNQEEVTPEDTIEVTAAPSDEIVTVSHVDEVTSPSSTEHPQDVITTSPEDNIHQTEQPQEIITKTSLDIDESASMTTTGAHVEQQSEITEKDTVSVTESVMHSEGTLSPESHVTEQSAHIPTSAIEQEQHTTEYVHLEEETETYEGTSSPSTVHPDANEEHKSSISETEITKEVDATTKIYDSSETPIKESEKPVDKTEEATTTEHNIHETEDDINKEETASETSAMTETHSDHEIHTEPEMPVEPVTAEVTSEEPITEANIPVVTEEVISQHSAQPDDYTTDKLEEHHDITTDEYTTEKLEEHHDVTTVSEAISSTTENQLFTSGAVEYEYTSKYAHVTGELSTSPPIITEQSTVVEELSKPIESTTPQPQVSTTLASSHHMPDENIPEMPDYTPSDDYEDDHNSFGPGTCRYGGKVYVSAQQIPRDDPCDFCFCFRSDIICLQQSCPPPIPRCHEEPIPGFCCPRYECPVSMAMTLNLTTTTTTVPPHFLPHAYKGAAYHEGCQIQGQAYRVGEVVRSASGPCLHCTCGGDGQMKCDPKNCSPQPMLQQMIAAAASRR